MESWERWKLMGWFDVEKILQEVEGAVTLG
jgi:hypothetical protein